MFRIKNRKKIQNKQSSALSQQPPVTLEHFSMFKCGEYQSHHDSSGKLLGRSAATDSGLSNNDLIALTRVAPGMNKLFQPILDQRKVIQLIEHVVRGEKKAVKQMIKAKPALLIHRNNTAVYDYSGRRFIDTTAFEAALRLCDIDMCRMLLPSFKKTKHNHAEKMLQFSNVFPRGIEPYFIQQKQEAYSFETLANSISNSSNVQINDQLKHHHSDSDICHAIDQFRTNFTKQILIEKTFNPYHLLNAMQTYAAHYDHWNNQRRKLYWRQVLGYVQRFLPANDAQVICQGMARFMYGNLPLQRSLLMHDYDSPDSIPYFPLDASKDHRLGFDTAVYISNDISLSSLQTKWPHHPRIMPQTGPSRPTLFFEANYNDYISEKIAGITNLYKPSIKERIKQLL